MRVIWQCTKKQFKEGWLKTLVNTHNMQITDGTIPGLYLRYYAGTNRISFYLAYRSAMTRKHRNILVGKYSDFKLEEIKDRAIKIRQMLATGIDPIEEQVKQKKKKEEELATRVTVDQVFEEYMEKYSKIYKKPSTQYSDGKEYKGYIQPRFGSMYIRDIEEKHIVDAYTEWAKATSFSTANKTLSLFSSMWDWSETYKYVPRDCNPCRHVKKGSNEKFKATVLDIDGYRRLFKALDDGMNHPGKHARMFRALKLLAFVVQLYEPETTCLPSNTANLLCSILCFIFVTTGMPASRILPTNEPLPLACVRSVITRTFAPRLCAARIESTIAGLEMEYTTISTDFA